MNIEQLKAIRAIAECGTFTLAAETLHLTQPALSQQIQALEAELGEPLFVPQGRIKRLSSAGTLVLEHARFILTAIERMGSELKAQRDLSRGEMVMAAGDNLTRSLLTGLIGQFAERYPGIGIHVRNRTSQEASNMVRSGEADLAFVVLPVATEGIEVREWQQFSWVAAYSGRTDVKSVWDRVFNGRAVKLAALSQVHLVLLEVGTRLRDTVDHAFREANCIATRVTEVGSTDLQIDLAALGIGVAIVPDYSVTGAAMQTRILPALGKGKIGVVWRQDGASAACRAFLKLAFPPESST